MKSNAKGIQRIGMNRRARRNSEIRALGVLTLDRFDRETGKHLGSKEVKNTWLVLGIGELISILGGGSTKRLTDANSTLVVTATSGGAVQYTNDGVDVPVSSVTAANANGYRLRWEFRDDTTTPRTNLNWAELCFKPTGDVDHFKYTRVNGNWGDKPTTENWRWRYDLELYSTDPDIKVGLHSLWLQNLAGILTTPWTAERARMTPSGGTAIVSNLASSGGNYYEFRFVSVDGNNNVTWTTTNIEFNHTGTSWTQIRQGGCRQDGSSCGTKVANEEWTYTWRYTLSPA